MKQLTEAYISFEIAQLLKEKGFDGKCHKVWEKHNNSEPQLMAAPAFVEGETVVTRESVDLAAKTFMNYYSIDNSVEGYLAPTQQMTMAWLREEYNLYIVIFPESDIEVFYIKGFYFDIWTPVGNEYDRKIYKTYEEACEAAIDYVLKNLI